MAVAVGARGGAGGRAGGGQREERKPEPPYRHTRPPLAGRSPWHGRRGPGVRRTSLAGSGHRPWSEALGDASDPRLSGLTRHPLPLGAKEDRTEEVTHRSLEASEGRSGDLGTGPGAPASRPHARASAVPGEPASPPGWGLPLRHLSCHVTGSAQSPGAHRGRRAHAHRPRSPPRRMLGAE